MNNISMVQGEDYHNISWLVGEDYQNHNISWFSADTNHDYPYHIDKERNSFIYDTLIQGILVCLFIAVGGVMILIFCLIIIQECKVRQFIFFNPADIRVLSSSPLAEYPLGKTSNYKLEYTVLRKTICL